MRLVVGVVLALLFASPAGAQTRSGSVILGDPNQEQGVVQSEQGDGRTVPVTAGGQSGRATAPGDNPDWGRYMYFGLDDQIAHDGYYVARVEVEYLDEGTGDFSLQYDSNDCNATLGGAYTNLPPVKRTNSGEWRTATFELPDARFANRENGGSDFRLFAGNGDASKLTVHRVTVTILEDKTVEPPVPDPGVANPVGSVSLQRSAGRLALDNGYVHAEFDLAHPQIDVLKADFGGRKRYAGNLLADGGIALERDGRASSEGAGPALSATVVEETPQRVVVRIGGIDDDPADPVARSTWTLSLGARDRSLGLQTATRALRDADVRGIRVAAHLSGLSAYGLFDRGVVQMINSQQPDFASSDHLDRAYFVGTPGGGAAEFRPTGQRQTVLHSRAVCGNAPEGQAARTGLELVLAGSHPDPDRWTSAGWDGAAPTHVRAGDAWTTGATIALNGHDFPAGGLTKPGPNVPYDDLRAIETASYATAVGVLGSYGLPGSAYPTLATPGRSYGNGNSFFDPDSWEIVRGLLYSGDRYLQEQARQVIERSGAAMLPSGQVPHHFEGADPTYVAISGATQTGPNIFWISSALDYAAATGDTGWLRAHMDEVENAMRFLTDRYDPGVKLISAPGPLWIDVFIRENYTSDTNAFMVGLLRRVAAAEAALGDDARASQHRTMADHVVDGMNEHLWAGDHYVTQLNPDGSTRDFVDYDANLLAVAYGVAGPDRAQAILSRVDAGECTHGRATWVSERFYGQADTYGGNTGDSATAMGRIGWADALARRAVGDRATYRNTILAPLRSDLLARTWLTERYDCAGNAIRAQYYHEYPQVVAMLLREVTYGIELGIDTVTIDPFDSSSYDYAIGNVSVSYSRSAVDVSAPGSGDRRYDIHGMTPGAQYQAVSTGPHASRQVVRADGAGVLRFSAGVTVKVRRLG